MLTLSFVASVLALGSMVHAGPLPIAFEDTYPEVIPGPGMPSLASLGLTSADLYQMTPVRRSVLEERALARRDVYCGYKVCTVANAQACVNYLNSLGTQNCMATAANNADFVQAAQCHIYGFVNVPSKGATASSYW